MADFIKALEEVKPAFGAATESLQSYCLHGIINCGENFDHLLQTLRMLVHQVGTDWKCGPGVLHTVPKLGISLPERNQPPLQSDLHPPFAPTFAHLQVQHSEKTPLLSCVLEGPAGSGKSALAATVALESDFPYIKVISPETMVGFSEQVR